MQREPRAPNAEESQCALLNRANVFDSRSPLRRSSVPWSARMLPRPFGVSTAQGPEHCVDLRDIISMGRPVAVVGHEERDVLATQEPPSPRGLILGEGELESRERSAGDRANRDWTSKVREAQQLIIRHRGICLAGRADLQRSSASTAGDGVALLVLLTLPARCQLQGPPRATDSLYGAHATTG